MIGGQLGAAEAVAGSHDRSEGQGEQHGGPRDLLPQPEADEHSSPHDRSKAHQNGTRQTDHALELRRGRVHFRRGAGFPFFLRNCMGPLRLGTTTAW